MEMLQLWCTLFYHGDFRMKKQYEKCKMYLNELYRTKEGYYLCSKCFKKETGNKPMGKISNMRVFKTPIPEEFV